jgi:hypothetical protein
MEDAVWGLIDERSEQARAPSDVSERESCKKHVEELIKVKRKKQPETSLERKQRKGKAKEASAAISDKVGMNESPIRVPGKVG